MRYISLPCSTKSSSWPGNTVLRLRTEFVLRLILSVIASRKGVPSFVRWVFADMAQKAAWVDTRLPRRYSCIGRVFSGAKFRFRLC
jgi:hypothetical protein